MLNITMIKPQQIINQLMAVVCAALITWQGVAQDAPKPAADDASAKPKSDVKVEAGESPKETIDKDVQNRLKSMFNNVLPKLRETVGLIDKHDGLPDKTYLFGDDKISNQSEIDDLLDDAIASLDVSRISELRKTIRQLQVQIRESHQKVSTYQQKKITAPASSETGVFDKLTLTNTREDYTKWIAAEKKNIEAWNTELKINKKLFIQALRNIGLNVSDDSADTLLFSVSGDDMVNMSIAFDNIKLLTKQLQTLTDENKEALDQAKRYYGMYVVMVQIMDRMQKKFVKDVETKYTPQLEKYIAEAEVTIEQARKLLDEGGNRSVLLSNIESNATTRKAAELYIRYLKEQKEMIEYENKQVEKTLAVAMNTYKTVKLSSDVATLIKTGSRNFEALMKLRLPYLREFNNEVIRNELKLMTEKMKK